MNRKLGGVSPKLVVSAAVFVMVLFVMLFVNSQIEKKFRFFGAPTVEQVKNLGHLAALKVYISDVLEVQGKGIKGAWLIKGDALIGVDMTGMSVEIIDAEAKKARIKLAPPMVMSPRVDHERTKTYDVDKSIFTSAGAESVIRDDAMKQAQRVIAQVANEQENIDKAKERLDELIKNFYKMVEWDVSIEWVNSSEVNASLSI